MYAVCNKNRVLAQMQCLSKEHNPVWGHHLNQRLSENHAGPFVFGATLGLHFAGNCVIKAGGVDCGLVAHSIE